MIKYVDRYGSKGGMYFNPIVNVTDEGVVIAPTSLFIGGVEYKMPEYTLNGETIWADYKGGKYVTSEIGANAGAFKFISPVGDEIEVIRYNEKAKAPDRDLVDAKPSFPPSGIEPNIPYLLYVDRLIKEHQERLDKEIEARRDAEVLANLYKNQVTALETKAEYQKVIDSGTWDRARAEIKATEEKHLLEQERIKSEYGNKLSIEKAESYRLNSEINRLKEDIESINRKHVVEMEKLVKFYEDKINKRFDENKGSFVTRWLARRLNEIS